MALKNNTIVTFLDFDIENIGPLRIGDEDSILIDKLSNNPYIPGSSIGGALRSYITERFSEDIAKEIFGTGDEESKIVVFDSIAENKMGIEFRPSVRIDNKLGVNANGGFFEREYLEEGHRFHLKFKLFSKNIIEAEKNKEILLIAINGVNEGYLRLGGHKTNGAGIFKINKAQEYTLNLKNKNELIKYVTDKVNLKELNFNLKSDETGFVKFKVSCTTKTPILIKGKGSLNYNLPDGANMVKDKNKELSKEKVYFIPGSSIKGSFKNGFDKIAKFKKIGELTDLAFGKSKDKNKKDDENTMGRVYFEDIKIKNYLDKAIYNRIKIDKFTGGVRSGAVLNEQPVKGILDFTINYKLLNNENDDKILALLIYTIKDMLEGIITLGGGNSIGRGKLKGDKIQFFKNGEEYLIDLSGTNHKNVEKINEILNSINKEA